MRITKSLLPLTYLSILIFLTEIGQLPALAVLRCAPLEVSPSHNVVPPIQQTVTLTLQNSGASAAVMIKPALTSQKLTDGNWRDVSDSIFIKPDANNPWQIANGKNALAKFHIQRFDNVLGHGSISTFRVTPHIEYYLQQDNLLPTMVESANNKIAWEINNPADEFKADIFTGRDDDVQIHVNNNLLKGRLTLRSAKSTYAAGKKYLVGILNKSDRPGWDSPLNKGASVIEYNDDGAIRAHPLHIFEVPFWNWELMQSTSAENATKMRMEIWMRGWQLHQTGDWWIENAFVVPKQKVKVLSTIANNANVILSEAKNPPDSPVTYLGEDRATQGNWRGAYGDESFILCAMQSPQDVVGGRILPKRDWPNGKKGEVHTTGVWSSWQGEFHYSVETGDPKEQVRHYIPPNQLTTNDKRALINPLEGGRRYASWDDHGETHPFDWKGPDLLVHLGIPKGLHRLSFYFVDWDFADTFRPRASRLFIEEDTKDAKVLSSAYISHFGGGVYKDFAVRGSCKPRVRITKDASVCAVLSGMFLDEINLPKVSSAVLVNPQVKVSAFAAYIKNDPPISAAAAKARVQHLLDSGDVGLARLAVPAWLHRAAVQSATAEISAFREAITMFALRDNDYATELATQLVSHAVKRGGSKVPLLQIGKEIMQLTELNQQGTLHSRAAYPVAVSF